MKLLSLKQTANFLDLSNIKSLSLDCSFSSILFAHLNTSVFVFFSRSLFNEFEPRLKSPENRFQLSAGLKVETLNTILSGTYHI